MIAKTVPGSIVLHPTCPSLSFFAWKLKLCVYWGVSSPRQRELPSSHSPAGSLELIIPSPGPHLMPFYFKILTTVNWDLHFGPMLSNKPFAARLPGAHG